MAFKQIVTTESNSGIIKTDNTLWMTGNNFYGQFGVGDGTAQGITFSSIYVNEHFSISYCPTFVKVLDNVEKVAFGNGFTMALTTGGQLLTAGNNDQGQLGINDSTVMSSPEFSEASQAVYDSNGQIVLDSTTGQPINVEPVNDISDFTCSGGNGVVLKNDGTVWMTGYSYGYGNFPVFFKLDGVSNISAISAGAYHIVALSNTGILSVFGYNTNGQLGLGDTVTRNTLTEVTDTGLLSSGSNISGIKCGPNNTYVLKDDGELWGVGENGSGNLGQGTTSPQMTFVLMSNFSQFDATLSDSLISDISNVGCGYGHNVVLQSDGTLLAAGNNLQGQFGMDPTLVASSPTFIKIAQDLGIVVEKIAVGNKQTMLITNDGKIYVAGGNYYNPLGTDTNAGTNDANFPFTLLDIQDEGSVASPSIEKKARFKVLHGMSTCFADKDPVLLEGEWAYETDTGFLKIGDGVTKWTELEYKIDDNLEKRVENYRKKITDAMGIDETGKDEEAIVTEIVDGVKKLFTDIMSEDSVYSYTCADLP